MHMTFGSGEKTMLTYDVDFGEPLGIRRTAALMTFKHRIRQTLVYGRAGSASLTSSSKRVL